ncbi:uncharacterized protein I303_101113 [Kwoniella dejecticola CBS 10117]|uniref:Uncharacterized protein n=1 Tax=Kwoniella dejecticola CBS 10117 TaxID=1296121 RepID=A0A1A6AGU6_9TREE|nr:uncharacterized protein I303_01117 [Kwoniella dejecticola CBS 10117]OBR89292.1 hypothetical protein I303_01117 [Kwoniella dejecticola CBS 10117]
MLTETITFVVILFIGFLNSVFVTALSPVFGGCITKTRFESIMQQDRSSYGLLSTQGTKLDCTTLCKNKKFIYAHFQQSTSRCFCTKTDEIAPDDIQEGCDHLGTCKACHASVTYLVSPLEFTGCYTHLLGKPFLELTENGNTDLSTCLSICASDVYDTEVVGFSSKFKIDTKGNLQLNSHRNSGDEKGKGRGGWEWEWKCACYSGKGHSASRKKLRGKCGKGSVWRFQVPQMDHE